MFFHVYQKECVVKVFVLLVHQGEEEGNPESMKNVQGSREVGASLALGH